ncbi:MAG: 16S rRNA (guanine(966)-N(2))-methyltransferase RsmD [Firmicutes bacterium]|jgi:16S rRNA (guanine(966)-N(2))-methyltransferase RsmD|nr:16S rRNA (guanine(966)-N(2))-methyltransferase RsmD [Bacillota bacterium]
MRVISGTARGVRLETIEGLGTRPTTDRVKENIFNIINWDIHGERVLDIFAGSGALGIEALSRGAEFCTFIEESPRAGKIIKENLNNTKLIELSEVIEKKVENGLNHLKGQYGVIIMDPPYNQGLIIPTLEEITSRKLLEEEGIIIVEHDNTDKLPDSIAGLERYKIKKYGRTCVSFFRRNEE